MSLNSCFDSGSSESSSGGGLFVDHKKVEDVFVLTLPANGTYTAGDNLDFVLQHPYSITVTGTPRLVLDIGGSPVYANYLAGNQTKNLSFRYTVQAGDMDSNGIDVNPTIDFNGGNLEYAVKGVINQATSSIFEIPNSANVQVDTQGPTLGLVIPPSIRTFYLGEQIDFIATFDEATVVAGTPRIALDVGGGSGLC